MPLHAWNIDFFKICVLDCGRLLRVDDITLERDRFDYARILLYTTSLDIINTGAQVMVDGVLFDFRIIEEWGFSLGEDVCLFDEEESQDDENNEMLEAHGDGAGCDEVDVLLNHMSEDWSKDNVKQKVQQSNVLNLQTKDSPTIPIPSASFLPQGDDIVVIDEVAGVISKSAPEQVPCKAKSQLCRQAIEGGEGTKEGVPPSVKKKVVKRTSSCPPGRVRAGTSGPWSLEWVNGLNNEDIGVSCAPKKLAVHNYSSQRAPRITKKKGSGYLRHCARSLKRIARLSDKDRKDVLCALQRTTKHRRAMSKAKEEGGKIQMVELRVCRLCVHYRWGKGLAFGGVYL